MKPKDLLKSALAQAKTPAHWLIGGLAKAAALVVHLLAENLILTFLTSLIVGLGLVYLYRLFKKGKKQ